MSDMYAIKGETLTAIADSVRAKTGGTEKIPVENIAEEIAGIQSEAEITPSFYSQQYSTTQINGYSMAIPVGVSVLTARTTNHMLSGSTRMERSAIWTIFLKSDGTQVTFLFGTRTDLFSNGRNDVLNGVAEVPAFPGSISYNATNGVIVFSITPGFGDYSYYSSCAVIHQIS